MTGTLDEFCDELMNDESPARRMEPERLAADFPRFFGLSGRPTLGELAEVFERAGIGKVSPANLPGALRGIHYTLSDESYAIRYQEDQWEGSSEYTLLHEAYEIVHETLGKRGHEQPSKRKVCLDADRFAAAVLMPADIFDAYARASGLDVVALHGVFRCSYAAAAIRLGEVMDRQPLFVALYERDEAGDPADWPEGTEPRAPGQGGEADGWFHASGHAPALRLPGTDSPQKPTPAIRLPGGAGGPERQAGVRRGGRYRRGRQACVVEGAGGQGGRRRCALPGPGGVGPAVGQPALEIFQGQRQRGSAILNQIVRVTLPMAG